MGISLHGTTVHTLGGNERGVLVFCILVLGCFQCGFRLTLFLQAKLIDRNDILSTTL